MAPKSFKLSSEYEMPFVGLGTWKAKPEEMEQVVNTALEQGYRHFDTAFNYGNEEAIGKSLKKWFANGGKRDDLFITTKLPNFGNRPSDVDKFIKLSLQNLGLDYVDMYLIHMPFSFAQNTSDFSPAMDPEGSPILDTASNPVETWKEMEKQVEKGLTKSIGLSNFNESQILEIMKSAKIKPANLQIELHANLQQKSLREFCKKNGIALTGYAPLGSPGAQIHFKTKYNYTSSSVTDILGLDAVKKIAANHNKTPAQTLLRHLLQNEIIVIPKSSSPERIRQNIDIFDFELTDAEMKTLDNLDQGPRGRIFNFLFFKGVEKHPYYPFKDELL